MQLWLHLRVELQLHDLESAAQWHAGAHAHAGAHLQVGFWMGLVIGILLASGWRQPISRGSPPWQLERKGYALLDSVLKQAANLPRPRDANGGGAGGGGGTPSLGRGWLQWLHERNGNPSAFF